MSDSWEVEKVGLIFLVEPETRKVERLNLLLPLYYHVCSVPEEEKLVKSREREILNLHDIVLALNPAEAEAIKFYH